MANRIASFTSNRGQYEFNVSQFTRNIRHLITKPQSSGLYKMLNGIAVESLEIETITHKGRLYIKVVTKRGNGLTGNIGKGGKVCNLIGAIDYQN